MSTKNAFVQRIGNAVANDRIVDERDEKLIFDVNVILGVGDHVDESVVNRFFGVCRSRRPSADASQRLRRTSERVGQQFRTRRVIRVRFRQKKRITFVVFHFLSFDEIPSLDEMSSQVSRGRSVDETADVVPGHARRGVPVDLILERLIQIAEISEQEVRVIFAEPQLRRALQTQFVRRRIARGIDEGTHVFETRIASLVELFGIRAVGFVRVRALPERRFDVQRDATDFLA